MAEARRRVRVLHVDDQPEFGEMAATLLEREHDEFTVDTVTSASEGLTLLAEGEFDCVVSDYEMPGTDGLEFLEAVRAEDLDLPFILFTGKGSGEVASEAIAPASPTTSKSSPGPNSTNCWPTGSNTPFGSIGRDGERRHSSGSAGSSATPATCWSRPRRDGR